MSRLLVFIFVVLTTSCAEDKAQTPSESFGVHLLFEYEGCKVYRFSHALEWHYFTNCTETMTHRSVGKRRVIENIRSR